MRRLPVNKLTLFITGDRQRFDNVVTISDKGIRPYLEFTPSDKALLGKQAVARFKLLGSRYFAQWQSDVPFIIRPGVNKVWPEAEEFIVTPELRLRKYTLRVELVIDRNAVYPWHETHLAIVEREPTVHIGTDASFDRAARNQAKDLYAGKTIDELLDL